MNILLANHHCFNFGGTENYTVDLARTLKTLGHNVGIYIVTKQDRMLSYLYFKKTYPEITWYIAEKPPNIYDLILINHNTSLRSLKGYTGYKIYTSHGLPQLEVPEEGADHYVFISEELFNRYPQISEKSIIKTGFFIKDFEEFLYIEKLKDPTCLLIDYTPTPTSSDYFMAVCKEVGVWAEIFSVKNIDPFGIKQLYKGFDLICATGRTALESVLHGKRTIIYSHFGSDGLFHTKYAKNNYSGRYRGTLDRFESELRKALIQSEVSFREVQNKVKDTRDIFRAAEAYLNLYRNK